MDLFWGAFLIHLVGGRNFNFTHFYGLRLYYYGVSYKHLAAAFGANSRGITASTHATAAAYVADISTSEQKAARFGYIGAGFGIGFVWDPL